MSLQTDNRRRLGPRDGLIGLGKNHRSCHRLGDDFVGLQPPAQRAEEGPDNTRELPWVDVLHKLPLTEPKEESGIQFHRGPMAVGHPASPLAIVAKANLASGIAARDHLCSKTAFVWGRRLKVPLSNISVE